jgi:hypothetical protein
MSVFNGDEKDWSYFSWRSDVERLRQQNVKPQRLLEAVLYSLKGRAGELARLSDGTIEGILKRLDKSYGNVLTFPAMQSYFHNIKQRNNESVVDYDIRLETARLTLLTKYPNEAQAAGIQKEIPRGTFYNGLTPELQSQLGYLRDQPGEGYEILYERARELEQCIKPRSDRNGPKNMAGLPKTTRPTVPNGHLVMKQLGSPLDDDPYSENTTEGEDSGEDYEPMIVDDETFAFLVNKQWVTNNNEPMTEEERKLRATKCYCCGGDGHTRAVCPLDKALKAKGIGRRFTNRSPIINKGPAGPRPRKPWVPREPNQVNPTTSPMSSVTHNQALTVPTDTSVPPPSNAWVQNDHSSNVGPPPGTG